MLTRGVFLGVSPLGARSTPLHVRVCGRGGEDGRGQARTGACEGLRGRGERTAAPALGCCGRGGGGGDSATHPPKGVSLTQLLLFSSRALFFCFCSGRSILFHNRVLTVRYTDKQLDELEVKLVLFLKALEVAVTSATTGFADEAPVHTSS